MAKKNGNILTTDIFMGDSILFSTWKWDWTMNEDENISVGKTAMKIWE